MNGRRVPESTLLVGLTAMAVVAVFGLDSGSPVRIVAGLLLAPLLPWFAASRLTPLREIETPGAPLAGAGALALALLILTGLLLTLGGAGLTEHRIAIGAALVTVALALAGGGSERPSWLAGFRTRSMIAISMTLVAVGIAVVSFTIARNRALDQERAETTYAAFLVERNGSLDVGLSNSTNRPARFSIHVRGLRREIGGTIDAGHTALVPGVVAGGRSSTTRFRRVKHRLDAPVEILITVTGDATATKKVLKLSSYTS